MASIFGIGKDGVTTIVGEMDDSMLGSVTIGGESCGAAGCGTKKKKKKKAAGESFEAKKAKLMGGKKKKPAKGTPEGDEDAITDPDTETPVGVGNTAKDKKKKSGESDKKKC